MSQYQSFFISASGNSSQCDEINHFLRSHVVIRTVENIINSGSNCGIQILVEYKDVQQMFSSLEKKPGAKKLTGVQALQQMTSVNFLTNLRILANQLKNQKEFLTKWNIFAFQNKTPNEKPFERNPEEGLQQNLEQWNIRNPLVSYKNVGDLIW